jgi:hypothetical protein
LSTPVKKTGWKKKMTSKTHAALHAAQRAARCRISEIGASFAAHQKRMSLQQTVCCTSKLHIQNASVIDP